MKKTLTKSLLLFLLPISANAQSCGGGYTQEGGSGVISCVPLYNGNEQNPLPSGPLWATRWGAIAFDPIAGKFGGIEGQSSENSAKSAALKECKRNGGKKCKIIGNHRNQCGALASGPNYTVAWGGPNKDMVIQNAIAACNKETTNCKAYYAGCSYAERVR